MPSRRPAAALAAAVVAALASRASAVTITTTGSFLSEIDRMKSLAFTANSGSYVAPTTGQLASFRTLADNLWTGNFLGNGSTTVDTQAAALGYEYVKFTDTDSGQIYFGLREKLTGGVQTKGWGTYYVNFNATANTLVEAPHILFDTNTEDLSARTFAASTGRGYLLAGAQRNSNGTGTADVAHLSTSVFNTVHQSWNGPTGATTAFQIHGFDEAEVDFPADTAAVVSAGSGAVTADMLAVDRRLTAAGFPTYGYNTLSPTNASNVTINGTVDGHTFSPLGATTNVQGDYSRDEAGGSFLHVEFAQLVRFNTANRILAAAALADAMRDQNPITTNLVRRFDGGAGGTSPSWTANTYAGWDGDVLPVATESVLFDTTLLNPQPASMTLTGTNMTVKNVVWNAPTSSLLQSNGTGSTDAVIALVGDRPESTVPLLQLGTLAATSSFTFANTNIGGGAGRVVLELAASGPIDVAAAGATLQIDSRVIENFPGRRITKTGAGLLVMTNTSNAFTGGVAINAGTLSVPSFAALGTAPASTVADQIGIAGGALRYTGGTGTASYARGITFSGGGTIDVTLPSTTLTLLAPLAGSGTFNRAGPGTLTLAASGTFSGTTAVRSGTLVLAANDALTGTIDVQAGGYVVVLGNVTQLTAQPIFLRGTGPDGAALTNASGSNAITAPVNLVTNTRISATSGALQLAGGIAGASDLAIIGNGSLSTARIRFNALSINNPLVRINPGRAATNTSGISALSLNGKTFDLGDNDLVLNYTGTSPLTTIRAALKTGYATGAWNGVGLTSSTAAAAGMAIGYIGQPELGGTTYDTLPIDSTTLIYKYTVAADTTLDGRVDTLDFARLIAGFASGSTWTTGDVNYDGVVNSADFTLLAANYGRVAPVPANLPLAVVPEPAMTSLLAATLLLIPRKKEIDHR